MKAMKNCDKHIYKKSIRVNYDIKTVIETTFKEVCKKTGLRLSYGRIARAFWSELAKHKALRKKCMNLVCKSLINDAKK